MSFVTVLQKIGTVAKDIWKVAAPVVKDVEVVAKDAEPFVAIAFPQFSGLFNMTVTLIGTAEGAAASAGATAVGPQKLAFVLAAIAPYVAAEAQNLGIAAPTVAQIKTWINAIVAALNAYEAK